MKKLAERFEIHAHALGKLCDDYGIPRPRSGYWTQTSVNKTKSISALSNSVSPDKRIDLSSLIASKREKRKMAATPLPHLVTKLHHHPLLRRIKGSFTQPQDKYNTISYQPFDDRSVMRLDVSKEQRNRAILILHTLTDAFEKRNWPLEVGKNFKRTGLENIIRTDGQRLGFRLRERLVQTTRALTKEEIATRARGGYVWNEKYNAPSGKLQLVIEAGTPKGTRSLFEDNEKLSLENQLGHFINALKTTASYQHELAQQRELQQRHLEQEQARKHEYEKQILEEQLKVKRLLLATEQWDRAQRCRHFLNKIRDSKVFEALNNSAKSDFIGWTNTVIRQIDPLTNGEIASLLTSIQGTESMIIEALARLTNDARS
ncbi:hypothetical protein Q4561_04275 [Alteromonas sp. 1_MG-2023]|uniref:hypothetical protein n=1 Tax=Alteromonas sp. 1_MG-2023 TaxID=3062669 RepID=UPI0026E2DF4A|nr:hypothetical protein [Alteromonas sp. 1_MG-2023]MDO6566262.1 hypothetical protein [Alteromonas sp. 1_MG-2023]